MLKDITFVCIGNSSIIGDSLGPLVGTYLSNIYGFNNNIKIFGTLDNNINFFNVFEFDNYKNSYIVLIDSALGNSNNIGNIIIDSGQLVLRQWYWKRKNSLWRFNY